MTNQEYLARINEFKEDFAYCVATNNGLEAQTIVKDMQNFIKLNKSQV